MKKHGLEVTPKEKIPFTGTDPKTGLPQGVDQGWDYQPGASVAEELARLQKMKADKLEKWQQAGGMVGKGTVESSAGQKKTRVVVFDQVDPTTADGLKTIFERLANNNPDWFPHGVKDVRFADLDPGVIASTDQAGGFDFSRVPIQELQNQSPAAVVQRALKRIQDKKLLTRQDEEVLRTMWHEIRHNMQPPFFGGGKERLIMETLHEVTTRHTFEEFAAELGFTPQYDKALRQKGMGYRQEVKHFHFIAKAAGWLDEDFKLKPEVVKMLDRVDRFDPSGQGPGGRIVLYGNRYLDNAAERLAATLGNSKPEAVKKMKQYLEDMVAGNPMNSSFGESVVKDIRRI